MATDAQVTPGGSQLSQDVISFHLWRSYAMHMFGRLVVTTVCVAGLVAASAAPTLADEKGNLTDFSSMTPVTGGAVGTINDRGIKGGGLPWVISTGSGIVGHDGTVDVTVTGLIITVPPVNGHNPVPFFKATVSCVTPDGVVNVSTSNFTASLTGDSHIHRTVDLPHPCMAPIIFVAAPTGQWFAMSSPDIQP
jgi:hypothetical protein